MTEMPKRERPPARPSDEATSEQLRIAREQGQSVQQAVRAMDQQDVHGNMQRAGDYLISYDVEEAEGLYYLRDGQLRWQEPEPGNAHVEIVVRDGADGRFVPHLTVMATLLDCDGNSLGTHQHPFLWHPWLYHYGRNWRMPGDGEYTLRVRVEVPDFPRHDKTNGQRYTEPAEVAFPHVMIKTGRKHSCVR